MADHAPILTDPALVVACLRGCAIPCPRCSHVLHAVSEPRCPECGCSLQVRVTCTGVVRWPWIASLVAASLAAGGVAFVVAWFAITNAIAEYPRWKWSVLWPFGITLMATVAFLLTIVVTRRRYTRSTFAVQVVLFMCTALVSIACVAYLAHLAHRYNMIFAGRRLPFSFDVPVPF